MVRGRLRSQHFWSWRENERTADIAVSFMRDIFLLARPNVSDVRFNEYFFIIYDEIFYENLLRKSRRILFYLEERGETFICRRGVSYVDSDITLKKNYFCIFFTYTLSKPEIPEEECLL